MLDYYRRYQIGLKLDHLFPEKEDKTCACGCGMQLTGRKKKWFNNRCKKESLNHFYIIKGDVQIIRYNLFELDGGHCRNCGVYDENWQADHITPVSMGGGACSLENFQTLCNDCHKEKTFNLNRVPYSNNIFASSFNVLPSSNYALRAINERISENVI